MANDKLMHDQEIHELKLKSQLDDNQRRKEIEDRTRQLQASKDELINENSKMNAKIVDQQQKIASHLLEIETLKRNNDLLRNVNYFFFLTRIIHKYIFIFFFLNQQLSEKENELMLNNEKSKSEYEKRLRSIQKDIDKCDEYKNKINDLEIKIKSK